MASTMSSFALHYPELTITHGLKNEPTKPPSSRGSSTNPTPRHSVEQPRNDNVNSKPVSNSKNEKSKKDKKHAKSQTPAEDAMRNFFILR